MILNFIKNMLKTYVILTSIFSFVNKSLMISILAFSTAINNAVLWIHIEILFEYMILYFIQLYDFKYYLNICF